MGALGGITAEGMINVLGRPALDPLTLVLRESAQNSWDARLARDNAGSAPPLLRIRIRTLYEQENRCFKALFSRSGAADEPSRRNELRERLHREQPIRVLEICDFSTVGLRGPVDPREPQNGGPNNFRNFFFEIGVAHPESGDGGTYGYGRSALYLASRARTILVDTLALEDGELSRRLLACRIGHAYQQRSFSGPGPRYTGRHFWGRTHEDTILPVMDDEASAIARGLGLPAREGVEDAGTSIVIPWPDQDGWRVTGNQIGEVILANLWPKLVSNTGPQAMHFEIEDEGRPVPVPSPRFHPVFRYFASALLSARGRSPSTGAREIRVPRFSTVTGHLGLELMPPVTNLRTPGEETRANGSEGEGPDPPPICRVALMRPSELVVRYLEISGARDEDRPWVGVFLCSEDPFVQTAFAASEPPAHDDWIPDRIEDEESRHLVRRTVKFLLPAAIREAVAPRPPASVSSLSSASLATAADSFAGSFLAGAGTAAAVGVGPRGSPGRGDASRSTSRTFRIGAPELEELRAGPAGRTARFRIPLRGSPPSTISISAEALIMIDGRRSGADDLPSGVSPPRVERWLDGRGRCLADGPVVRLASDTTPGELVLEVSFGDYAISVSCAVRA